MRDNFENVFFVWFHGLICSMNRNKISVIIQFISQKTEIQKFLCHVIIKSRVRNGKLPTKQDMNI